MNVLIIGSRGRGRYSKGVSLTMLNMSVKTARETRLQLKQNKYTSIEARVESTDVVMSTDRKRLVFEKVKKFVYTCVLVIINYNKAFVRMSIQHRSEAQ